MLYHWESVKIIGEWASVAGEWYVRVDCKRYGVAPYMLEGRCVTVKGLRQRLGDLSQTYRAESYYYKPWKTEDFQVWPALRERLAQGAQLAGTEREAWERDLRQDLKSIAARIRNHRAGPKTLDAWCRWALEPLDDTLCAMAATGMGALPLNQFCRSPITDGQYLAKALEFYGRLR